MSGARAYTIAISLAIALMASSCGQKKQASADQDESRSREIDLFQNVIRTVQDRYVDVDRTQLDLLISNSLKGMVEAVDPYAEILPAGIPVEAEIPGDASMVELGSADKTGISILRIYGFNEQLRKQLRRLEAELKNLQPSGILLDCRGAHGDDYSAAAAMAEWFLPRNSDVGTLIEKQGSETNTLFTRRSPLWTTNTLVVLIDRQLSGPGELLAVALKHYDRCLLVGEPSRGVAVIQSVISLADDWKVRLSTGRVLGPGGHIITGYPMIPDISAQQDPDNKENVDWIFHRGMSVLQDPPEETLPH